MKPIRSLILLAFGMIASTAFASTKMPETKQTTTIAIDYQVVPTVANVLSFEIADYAVAVIVPGVEPRIYLSRNYEPVKSFAAILDVGWQSLDNKFKQIPYTEKLHSNYLIDQEKNLQKLGVTLSRSNC